MKIIKGNVVDAVLNGEIDYLVHGTNSQGKFASGVAGEIRKRIPEAYQAYMKQYQQWIDFGKKGIPLGDLSCGGNVINLCSQEFYGRDGKRYANYGAIASGFCNLYTYLQEIDSRCPQNLKVGVPWIGAGLGGCDPKIIKELIEHCLDGCYASVTIYGL
jgi:O-acetyl-ADP-ribose deacetylase (regulator of RNase III)